MFLLNTIQRKNYNNYSESWRTFYRANRPTNYPIEFNLCSSHHTFFFEPAPNSDNTNIMDPNLRWGITLTADKEPIRVLFIIDHSQPIRRNLTLPPAHKTILSRLFDRDDKNLYFKRSTLEKDYNYSRYFIFHSLNPIVVNPNHFVISIANTTLATIRIQSAHKYIALYKLFMSANKNFEWQLLPGQEDTFVLSLEVPQKIHEKVYNLFVRDNHANSSNPIPLSDFYTDGSRTPECNSRMDQSQPLW